MHHRQWDRAKCSTYRRKMKSHVAPTGGLSQIQHLLEVDAAHTLYDAYISWKEFHTVPDADGWRPFSTYEW